MTTSTKPLHEPELRDVKQLRAHFSLEHGALAWADLRNEQTVQIAPERMIKLLRAFPEGQRP